MAVLHLTSYNCLAPALEHGGGAASARTLDGEALHTALDDVMARHESLRTVVGHDWLRAWQVIRCQGSRPLSLAVQECRPRRGG